MTERLGLTPPIEVTGFAAAVDLCARAEQLGYTDVWSAEVGAVDAFSPLAAIAVKTERVRLGTALVPVFNRPPALTAMSAAGLQQLSGGRVAGGVLFYFFTPDGVRRALQDVHEGAREAGRDPDELDVFLRLPVAAEEPEDTARFMGRRMLTGYAIVPAYNASLSRQGFAEEARAIAEAWNAGERDRATELFSDRMLDELFVTGDAETCRARIEEFRRAGV